MDALVYWRADTLRKRVSEGFPQLTSPLPPSPSNTQRHQQREPTVDQQAHIRSQSEPSSVAEMRKVEEEDKMEAMAKVGGEVNGAVSSGTNNAGSAKKPTSSSWVQWWSRSRKKNLGDTNAKDTANTVNGILNTVCIHCFYSKIFKMLKLPF